MFQVINGSDACAEQLLQASALLQQQWPGKTLDQRSEDMHRIIAKGLGANLPCILLLVEGVLECVGHVQVLPAAEQFEGKSAIVYSLVVSSGYRGKGLGRMLMDAVEKHCIEAGYCSVYLFTDDQELFYKKCGYNRSPKVSSLGSLSGKLTHSQLQNLESLFAKKSQTKSESLSSDSSIWMRKFVIESCEEYTTILSKSTMQSHIHDDLPQGLQASYIQIPWQRQIGPSCGLALLRMINRYFQTSSEKSILNKINFDEENLIEECQPLIDNVSNDPNQSLLQTAKDQGFTIEGEILSCKYLQTLSQSHYGHQSSVESLPSFESLETKINNHQVILLAYDRSPNNLPERIFESGSGQHPHWLMVVGTLSNGQIIGIHGMSESPLLCNWEFMKRSNESLNVQGMQNTYQGRELQLVDDDIELAGLCVTIKLALFDGF